METTAALIQESTADVPGAGRALRICRAVAVLGVTAWMIWRLFGLINRYSVNILFWDQWAFYTPLFKGAGLWRLFTWPHGPHRQGVGYLVIKAVAELTGWNTRAEVFAMGGILCLALALLLRWRLFGRPAWTDILLPLIFLTPIQIEVYVGTPNPAHGIVPLCLLMGYGLSWTVTHRFLRYGLVLGVNFLSIFTGFGLFVGMITPMLIALDGYLAIRRRNGRDLALAIAGLAVCVASIALFFRDYSFAQGAPGFRFPDPLWYLYPHCMALALGNVAGFRGTGVLASIIGWVLMAGCIFAVFRHGRRLLRQQDPARTASLVTAVLIVFSLLFAANMAVGRIFLGLDAAQASRYVPLLMPAFVGLYFHLLSLSPGTRRTLCMLAAVALMAYASLPVRRADRDFMRYARDGKTSWVRAYLQTESIDAANRASWLRMYPWPDQVDLAGRLRYLKQHHLNLYHP